MTAAPGRTARIVLAMLLALLAAPAFALGLGQIQVRSQAGQPLLAEIPIISSDPTELDNLQARLASPETFARIGLDPPQGIVSDLQFAIALDPRGQPVIRVTSAAPVQQSLLTFLVEVDWGQGRLVREYSALLDAPRTVSAPSQPAIEAPVVAPSTAIVREPGATPIVQPVAPATPASTAPTAPAPNPVAATPAPAAPSAPVPAPAPAAIPPASPPAPSPAPRESAARNDTAIPTPPRPAPAAPRPASAPAAVAPPEPAPSRYAVQTGDTLSKIAGTLGTPDHSLDQTMLALLRANPDAFIGDNVNLIRSGAVLRAPSEDELARYSAAEARVVVREHIGRWRELAKPMPQPEAVAGATPAATPAAASNAPTTQAGAAKTTSTASRSAADGRLEIVPPSANGKRAGTQSGINAGGEGNMLQQQELQQTKESLAARDAEVQELKARVADLEKLQQDQQKLIALKNGELASAQQNLAKTQATPLATPATAQASTSTPPSATAAPATPADAPVWPWLLVALIVVALIGWLVARRRAPRTPKPVFDAAELAAAVPAVRDGPRRRVDDEIHDAEFVDPAVAVAPVAPAKDTPAPRPVMSEPMPETAMPTWHAGGATAASDRSRPTPGSDAIASLNPAPAGSDRLELARAYVDLGDVDTARTLLQEVVDGGNPAASAEAARLLRDLA